MGASNAIFKPQVGPIPQSKKYIFSALKAITCMGQIDGLPPPPEGVNPKSACISK